VRQPVPEQGTAPRQTLPHGLIADAKLLCDSLRGVLLPVMQHQYFPAGQGKAFQHFPHEPLLLAQRKNSIRRSHGIRNFGQAVQGRRMAFRPA
jgi:hypothetical protein